MEAVSPSPFTNSCGDGQEVFEGSSAHSLFPVTLLLPRSWHHTGEGSSGGCWAALLCPQAAVDAWNQPNSLRAPECQGTVVCSPNLAADFSPWHEMVCGNSFSKWCPEIFHVIQDSLL